MKFRLLGVCLVVGVLDCGTPPPTRSATTPKPTEKPVVQAPLAPAEPPLTDLVTGALTPVVSKTPIELALVAKYAGADFEILKFSFSKPPPEWIDAHDVVVVPGAVSAFVSGDPQQGGALWVRRARERSSEPVAGNILKRADQGPGVRYPLLVKPGGVDKASTRALEGEWLTALGAVIGDNVYWPNPATAFMARRLREMVQKQYGAPQTRAAIEAARGVSGRIDLYELMDTTTGRSALQKAIQHEYALAVSISRDPKKLPLSAAGAHELPQAPYATMLSALGTQPPAEPLALAAPADCWYLRARTFEAFFELLDLSESFGQPTADLLAGRSDDRGTTARYTAELALERTELARVLGPSVIDSVAVVGSDPYVHDGTDLTFLFKVTASPLFEAALAKALARHSAEHGDAKTSTFIHEGVTVRVARSADGRVRQHRASVAGLELVSNSPAAIRRVISAALGKSRRLADELDFRYMTARDAGTPDEVMVFLSDRFVTTVVGPAQKIAQARRQLALAELSAPGFAALLFGTIHGKSPKDDKELVKDGELLASELKHADGAPISFLPGKAASSRWGTTTYLEPLIDLPPVVKISASEQRAYQMFWSSYAPLWSEYLDPIIVRFARSKESPKKLEMALRALPLYRGDTRELIDMVGTARVEVPPLDSGLRWVLALGKDAELRRELDGRGRFGRNALRFDWLGDSVTLGLADRSELTRVARATLRKKLEAPTEGERRGDELEALVDLPVYAAIEVKNRVGAVVALGTLRKMAEDIARDMFAWRDAGKHRGVSITDIEILPSGMLRQGGHVYYALCPNALIFSLNRAVLEGLIDAELDGKAPRGITDPKSRSQGQLVIELGAKKDGALIRTLGWLIAASLVEQTESRETAEAILRGAPEARASAEAFRELSRAYLGQVPLTPDGRLYEYSPEGIRDPLRGTAHAPIFPPTPTPGSPLASVLARFVRLRSSISFDTEPGSGPRENATRSLSTKLSLELR
jgi:hypothetical protein